MDIPSFCSIWVGRAYCAIFLLLFPKPWYCSLVLCGGAGSVSGVYRGLNRFLRDSGYFCKRCLLQESPLNSQLCVGLAKASEQNGLFPSTLPPSTAGSRSPRCRYPVGGGGAGWAVPGWWAPSHRCGQVAVASSPRPPPPAVPCLPVRRADVRRGG